MTITRRLRVILIKPYQPAELPVPIICQPQLGILYLAAALRRHFGGQVDVAYRDMNLCMETPEKVAAEIAGKYDLAGISALTLEADAAHSLAGAIRTLSPDTVIALGGPYARSARGSIMAKGDFDWIFHGEADLTFPRAVEARFFVDGDLSSVPGLTWRAVPDGPYLSNDGDSPAADLDALPLPAWDLAPLDAYARRHNMNGTLRARRYAPLFTSRGCPYRCSYCHDIFGRKTRFRSPDNVLAEIDLLKNRYGVKEFQIIDDIFNLDRRRMREIAEKIIARHGRRRLFFTFPNGVRGDIIILGDLPLLRDMGVYDMGVAVETASPRLQKLINKGIDLGRIHRTVEAAVRAGISVKGFFMLGFPTETREELEATIRFAVESKLSIAYFFSVIPQHGTPLHVLAESESREALAKLGLNHYFAGRSWYELAYGVDMSRLRRDALRRFYLRPGRLLRVLRRLDRHQLSMVNWQFFKLLTGLGKKTGGAESEAEIPRPGPGTYERERAPASGPSVRK